MNPDFPAIIDETLKLRDRFYPRAKVSVLTNATTVTRPEIFGALCKVDNPVMKLDAASLAGVKAVNRPTGHYDIEEIIAGLRKFGGNFVLQTMFLSSPEFDTASRDNIEGWMDIVRQLGPREVMVYTLDRETPEKDLVKFSEQRMASLVKPLVDEGFNIQIRG